MPGDADHGILHTDNGSGLGSGATSSRPSQQRTGGMLHTTPASCSGTSLLGLPGQASPTLRHGVLAAAGPQQSSRGLADPAAGDTASASTIADMTHGPALAAVGSDQSHSGSFAFMPPSALFPPAPGVHPGPGPGPPAAGGDPERIVASSPAGPGAYPGSTSGVAGITKDSAGVRASGRQHQGVSGPPSRQPSRRSSSKRPITGGRSSASWWLTAAVVFKASLGLGVLALPSSFARLGWLPSIACLGALTLGVLYIGTLYRRLFMPQRLPDGECGTPSSTSSRAQVHGNVPLLHEVGARAAGAVGQWAVALTVYSVIFLLPALFHITAVEALEQLFPPGHAPTSLMLGFIVLAAVLPLAQAQGLEQVGWASLVGSGAMVAAVLMATTRLLLAPEHNCAAASALGYYATTDRPSLLLSTQGPSAPGDQVASMMLTRQPTHGSVGSIHSSVSALSCGSLPRRLLGIGSMVLVAASRRGALGGGMGMGMPAAARHEWIAHDGFAPAMVGVMDFVFSFSGQENWPRLIAGMRDRRRFSAAVVLSTLLLAPLLGWIGGDGWSIAINAGVLMSVLMSYLINLNVWTRTALSLAGPQAARDMMDALESPLRGSEPKGHRQQRKSKRASSAAAAPGASGPVNTIASGGAGAVVHEAGGERGAGGGGKAMGAGIGYTGGDIRMEVTMESTAKQLTAAYTDTNAAASGEAGAEGKTVTSASAATAEAAATLLGGQHDAALPAGPFQQQQRVIKEGLLPEWEHSVGEEEEEEGSGYASDTDEGVSGGSSDEQPERAAWTAFGMKACGTYAGDNSMLAEPLLQHNAHAPVHEESTQSATRRGRFGSAAGTCSSRTVQVQSETGGLKASPFASASAQRATSEGIFSELTPARYDGMRGLPRHTGAASSAHQRVQGVEGAMQAGAGTGGAGQRALAAAPATGSGYSPDDDSTPTPGQVHAHGHAAAHAEMHAHLHASRGVVVGSSQYMASGNILDGSNATMQQHSSMQMQRTLYRSRTVPRDLTWGEQRLLWLIVSTCGALFGYMAGHLFPFFSELMAAIASVGDLAAMFVLPCAFALRLLPLGRVERVACWCLAVGGGVVSLLGAVASVQQLVSQARGGE